MPAGAPVWGATASLHPREVEANVMPFYRIFYKSRHCIITVHPTSSPAAAGWKEGDARTSALFCPDMQRRALPNPINTNLQKPLTGRRKPCSR